VSDPVAARWWESFFQGRATDLWERTQSRELSRGQASDLIRALRLGGSERVLDVPCGNGRLALELAARGLRVTGLDLSQRALEVARATASERGLALELVRGDMRELAGSSTFDAAFCVGNSFGYLDDAGNRAFLSAVAAALVPGGRFLLEYPLVAELALERREARDWRLVDELLMLSDGHHDPIAGRFEVTYTFLDLARPGGAAETSVASYAVYTAREVDGMLRAAGFEEVELLADLEGTAFDGRSPGFHALATR
jgi:SAM-dependent methyltransferase